MTKILMVCLGNICRSPLAHAILESKLPSEKFSVDSAGTGDYHIGQLPDHRSIATGKKYGLDLTTQRCRQFNVSDFDNFDIIYVMDHSNYENVIKLARNSNDKAKVRLILQEHGAEKIEAVPDPYWGTSEDFDKVYTVLNEVCDKIVHNLTS